MWNKVRSWMVPLGFSAYPALAMYAANLSTIGFDQILRMLALSIAVGAVVTGVLQLCLRDLARAGAISTIWLIAFFSYGQVYDQIHRLFGAGVGRNVFLVPFTLALMAGVGVWVWRFARSPDRLLSFLGYATAVLMILVGSDILGKHWLARRVSSTAPEVASSSSAGSTVRPDIYYIILDGHGRQDILQELYGYDDSGFIQFLRSRGFYVADAAHSNYIQTELSLASSLNLDYLDQLGLHLDPSSPGRSILDDRIKHSLVRRMLAEQGYRTVGFSNAFPTALTDADVYYDFAQTAEAAQIHQVISAREIETMFLSSTLLRVAVDRGWLKGITNDQQPFKYHYAEVQYIFKSLAEIPQRAGDYFVLAHIVAPHPPFVFDADGRFVYDRLKFSWADGSYFAGTRAEYLAGYAEQAAYVDWAAELMIDGLLAGSATPPIIIVQGDHGPGAYLDWNSVENTDLDERLSILSAYYFPQAQETSLYESITPVNSFRILFDAYFGTDFGRLPDRCFYSPWYRPFDFTEVTTRLR